MRYNVSKGAYIVCAVVFGRDSIICIGTVNYYIHSNIHIIPAMALFETLYDAFTQCMRALTFNNLRTDVDYSY